MAEFKLSKDMLNENWGTEYERLLRSWKFQCIAHSDKPEDGVEAIWLYGQLMQNMLTGQAFTQLLAQHDDDIIAAWEDLAGKLKSYTESQKDD